MQAILVEAARGDAEGGTLGANAATLPAGDSPPWRSNYLACAAWPASSFMESFIGARVEPCRRRRRACHEHPDKDARNGKRMQLGHV